MTLCRRVPPTPLRDPGAPDDGLESAGGGQVTAHTLTLPSADPDTRSIRSDEAMAVFAEFGGLPLPNTLAAFPGSTHNAQIASV